MVKRPNGIDPKEMRDGDRALVGFYNLRTFILFNHIFIKRTALFPPISVKKV